MAGAPVGAHHFVLLRQAEQWSGAARSVCSGPSSGQVQPVAPTCSSPTVLRPLSTSSRVDLPLPEGLHVWVSERGMHGNSCRVGWSKAAYPGRMLHALPEGLQALESEGGAWHRSFSGRVGSNMAAQSRPPPAPAAGGRQQITQNRMHRSFQPKGINTTEGVLLTPSAPPSPQAAGSRPRLAAGSASPSCSES